MEMLSKTRTIHHLYADPSHQRSHLHTGEELIARYHSQTPDRICISRLFNVTKRCLRQHGELWVVGNRHLNYLSVLRQQFGDCTIIATIYKFSVFRAIKC